MGLITLHQVRFGYGDNIVIDNLSLTIEEQDFICIVGSNGAGKTTLVKGIWG